MIKKKHVLLITIILIISILSVGCKSAEEKVIEKALGEDVKTDTNNNEASIEKPDMTLESGENLEWPADKMYPLPNPDAKINTLIESVEENLTVVHIEFNEPGLARDYIQKVKDLGYIEGSMREEEGTFEFIGYKEDNTEVSINYLEMREVGYISLKRDSNAVKEFFENN